MMSTIHVYCVEPIDDFYLWMKPSNIFNEKGSDGFLKTKDFEHLFDIAKVAAKQIGWEGDIIEGPFVSVLPPESGGGPSLFIVAWKQVNNGTCFIASPYRLPWIRWVDDKVVGCYINQKPGHFKLVMNIEKPNPLGIL